MAASESMATAVVVAAAETMRCCRVMVQAAEETAQPQVLPLLQVGRILAVAAAVHLGLPEHKLARLAARAISLLSGANDALMCAN